MQNLRECLACSLLLATFTQALLTKLLFRERCCIGVESKQHLLILQRVLLLHTRSLRGRVALRLVEHALHLTAVDETRDIGVADDIAGQEEVGLQLAGLSRGAVDIVEGSEGVRCPDDEATQVTTWCELEEIQGVDWAGLNTRDVAECTDESLAILLVVVNHQWATALTVAAPTHLTFTGAQLAGLLDLDDIWACTDGLQKGCSNRGLDKSGGFKGSAANDEWNFRDGPDAVAAGEKKGGNARCCDGGGGCEASGRTLDRAWYSMTHFEL